MTDGKVRKPPPTPKRRFVRIYYDDLEKGHPGVWFDPTCLSTYARLLAGCDKAWPSDPEMPAAVRRADLAELRASGLVIDHSNHRYTVKGYAKERGERMTKAKLAADERWHADGDADA